MNLSGMRITLNRCPTRKARICNGAPLKSNYATARANAHCDHSSLIAPVKTRICCSV